MMMVFLKDTLRPWLSVTMPSSRMASRMLNTSACAFSTCRVATSACQPGAAGPRHELVQQTIMDVSETCAVHVARTRATVRVHKDQEAALTE